jgi:hypothetical protein
MNPAIPAFAGSDQGERRETALAQWQAQIRRLRLLVEQADEFTPSAFVKRVDESLAELRKAAMETVIHVEPPLTRRRSVTQYAAATRSKQLSPAATKRRDAMIINKDNNGKPIGFIETIISNERVVTVNATRQAATVTTRDRANGKVKTETFYGTLPLPGKD